ncbi:MAG: ABC transporter permease [Pirellulales bacterium]|nr:ABC transporter permease [Pirellulales bacterium]
MSNLAVWLTPIWLLAVGTSLGALVVFAFWALCWLLNRRWATAMQRTVSESVLLPITYALLAMAALALISLPVMPVDRLVSSLKRLPHVGPIQFEETVKAGQKDYELKVAFRVDELQSYSIESEQEIAVNVEPGKGFAEPLLVIEDTLYQWKPSDVQTRGFEENVQALYITNESDLPTVVRGVFLTNVEMPEVHDLVIAAGAVILLYLIYFMVSWLAPSVSIISTATAKEAVSQPLFLLLTLIGVVALIAFVYIPYNTFGEDVKMLKTSGMTTIKVLAIITALWTASVSVAEEIEGRTALTVLSKPVGRRQFILGKFMGIVWPIVLMFVILGIVFLVTVSFKVVYDAREAAKSTPDWQLCYEEVVRIVPGLVLAFMEAVVMASISVAISTRLSMLPNLVICGSIYVLGHLGPLIVKSAIAENVFVAFVGRLIAVLLPVLDHYEIEGAIAGSSSVPPEYLGMTLLYSVLYCTAAMLMALILFEDRDLA